MTIHREDGYNDPEVPLDDTLAAQHGGYASYAAPNGPVRTDFHGDNPAAEMDRLLDLYAEPGSSVLDLGCGAGFTMCRLAPKVVEIWGIDLHKELLKAAQARADRRGLSNIRTVRGDTTDPEAVAQLPDGHFDFAFSRRGPFLTPALLPKLKAGALFVVELAQDSLGIKEMFGRTPFLPRSSGDPDWAISHHYSLGYVPVSSKSYWYEEWFRDEDHLAQSLARGASLSNWWMAPCPFDPVRDRAALELFCRYNRAGDSIRVVGHRRIYVFRPQSTQYYPALT